MQNTKSGICNVVKLGQEKELIGQLEKMKNIVDRILQYLNEKYATA